MNDIVTHDVLKVFRMYIGLKLHFSSNDFIYHDAFGSEKINDQSMNNRNDVDTFINVTDKFYHNIPELKSLLISGFKKNQSMWIGDVLKKSVKTLDTERKHNIFNITNIITRDIEHTLDYMNSKKLTIDEMIDFKGDRPLVVKKIKASDEFLALLDFKYNYLCQETENPLWKKRSFSLYKYKYLMEVDVESMMHHFDKL